MIVAGKGYNFRLGETEAVGVCQPALKSGDLAGRDGARP